MLLTLIDPEVEWCDVGGDQFAPRGLPTLLYSSKLNKDANNKSKLKHVKNRILHRGPAPAGQSALSPRR